MAITDALLSLSATQTVTGASAVLSTNTIDLGVSRDIGMGTTLQGVFQVNTTFTGLTALEMQVIYATDAALTTGIQVIGTTGAVAVARLVAGNRFAATINPDIGRTGARYVGARYLPTGTGTAGALTASIQLDVQEGQKHYASGFTVI